MNNIKKARIAANLKQSDLAKMLNVGQTTISNWETGYSQPDLESLRTMARLFDCSIDELLGQKEKPVVKDDRLNRKLELLNDENLQRMEDYVDLLLKTQGE
jgi:transcriptional regulator with XRE-family HTH domain|nr:MAG TPA: helix-turn-helix domain protein [Caudoviricetes sp.]DAP13048.1 MAG TPA: helix-turn-helix domain protein [Caudoviricetes sp.]